MGCPVTTGTLSRSNAADPQPRIARNELLLVTVQQISPPARSISDSCSRTASAVYIQLVFCPRDLLIRTSCSLWYSAIRFRERVTEGGGFKIPAVSRRSGPLSPGVVPITTFQRLEAELVHETKHGWLRWRPTNRRRPGSDPSRRSSGCPSPAGSGGKCC